MTIIETAAKLVDEEGSEQLTLGSLAERLGIRTPSLYNHIAGLPGLKHDLTLYCLRDVFDHITQAIIGKARADAIFALADAYLSYARKAPGRYAFSVAPAPDNQEEQTTANRLTDIVRAILAPYKLSEEEEVHAIRSLRSIIHGFILLDEVGGFRIGIDADVSFHWLLSLFITGLEKGA